MSIGLWDGDLTSIGQVPFNLELMKIAAYYKSKKEIVVMSPKLEPERYKKFFIRKDWDDENYPPEFFRSNCSYGGRAFSPLKYRPLAPEIEMMEPDVYIYSPLENMFQKDFYTLQVSGIHLRLENGFKDIGKVGQKSLIVHDYDINSIHGAYEYVKDILERTDLNLQTKFPICVDNAADLSKWTELKLGRLTTVKICGIMDIETMECVKNMPKKRLESLVYDISDSYQGQKDFVKNKLPVIFHQLSILRKFNPKNLLIFDSAIFKSKELSTLLNMMNDYARPMRGISTYNTKDADYTLVPFAFYIKTMFQASHRHELPYTVEEARAAFQFVRENNYELFKEFYQNDWRDFL